MSHTREYEVPDGLVGERLDIALARLTGLSRTRVAALIEGGSVHLDGAAAARSARLDSGSSIEVDSEALKPQRPTARVGSVDLAVLFEDEHLIVVDKPAGVAAHASPGWDGHTVVGSLWNTGVLLADCGAEERRGVVHRLDVGTTGVMVLAKSAAAYSGLKNQFRDRKVSKRYRALVQGRPDPSRGTIDAPIGRHPRHRFRFAVVSGGRESITRYWTLEAFRRATLLEIELATGRTHQIRVHLAAIHHPCCGDLTYGADPTLASELGLSRQWLHAASLTVDHPVTGRRLTWRAATPADLEGAIARCRGWVRAP